MAVAFRLTHQVCRRINGGENTHASKYTPSKFPELQEYK